MQKSQRFNQTQNQYKAWRDSLASQGTKWDDYFQDPIQGGKDPDKLMRAMLAGTGAGSYMNDSMEKGLMGLGDELNTQYAMSDLVAGRSPGLDLGSYITNALSGSAGSRSGFWTDEAYKGNMTKISDMAANMAGGKIDGYNPELVSWFTGSTQGGEGNEASIENTLKTLLQMSALSASNAYNPLYSGTFLDRIGDTAANMDIMNYDSWIDMLRDLWGDEQGADGNYQMYPWLENAIGGADRGIGNQPPGNPW